MMNIKEHFFPSTQETSGIIARFGVFHLNDITCYVFKLKESEVIYKMYNTNPVDINHLCVVGLTNSGDSVNFLTNKENEVKGKDFKNLSL